MIIVRVMGGLGNQLQQYALYRKLEHIGRDARIDTSWFDNQAFQASVSAGRELEMERLVPPDYKKADEQDPRRAGETVGGAGKRRAEDQIQASARLQAFSRGDGNVP